MILHFVALNLKEPAGDGPLLAVLDGLAGLVGEIDGFVGFEHGPNLDFEQKSADFPYAFLCRFDDADAVARYANDPRHQALGAKLVSLCKGGADGITVFDIEVA